MAAESTSFVLNRWMTMHSALWNFTLDFYAKPGVEAALLHLQDRGANVCALICGVWLGQRGVPYDAARADILRRFAADWEKRVVRPLRELRCAWKADSARDEALSTLRDGVKRLELDAEAELVRRLEALTDCWHATGAGDTDAWLADLAPAAGLDALDTLRVMAGEV